MSPAASGGSTLLSEIAARRSSNGRNVCTVGKVLEALDAEDCAALTAALADPKYEGSAIGRALRDREFRVSDGTIQRHRNRICRCPG